MPAFGKDGIVNLNKNETRENWLLVKPDGTVVLSCNNKQQLESHIQNLSQKFNCELKLVKQEVQCL